jgi:hypothetical protein
MEPNGLGFLQDFLVSRMGLGFPSLLLFPGSITEVAYLGVVMLVSNFESFWLVLEIAERIGPCSCK